MADQLLQEVDADLRAEQLTRLWQRYRSLLLLIVIALLIGTAGNSLWENYREKKGGELFAKFADAETLYEQGKFTESAAAFEAAGKDATSDARVLAQLWQGRALVRAGKKQEAITVLNTASDSRTLWGDLACLRLAGLDNAAAPGCLGDTRDSPLIGKRREWHAATAWNDGKKAEAIATFEELATSDDTTEATRTEINGWLSTLRADDKPAGVKEERPAAAKTDSDVKSDEEKSAE